MEKAARDGSYGCIAWRTAHDPFEGFTEGAFRICSRAIRQSSTEGRTNRWPAAHVLDVAHLYRLALVKHEAGSRYNAVAEEGITMREIAEVVARSLEVPAVSLSPEEAPAHFGWLAMFAGFDMPASSAQTQQRIGWRAQQARGSFPISTICSISKPE
jgi:nucleoside-diphosphate-sugar epimerase